MSEDTSNKEPLIEMTGMVEEALPAGMFRVKLENDLRILCVVAGRIRKNRIRIIMGDRVDVEISSYDWNKGRITYRYKA